MTATCHILGASGRIGSVIADRLAERSEWSIRCWDSASCDLLDPEAVRNAFAGRSSDDRYVFCAARVRDRGNDDASGVANRRMLEHLWNNLEGRCAHFVFLSSVDVYGHPPDGTVLDETSALMPDGAYAESKVWSETRLSGSDNPCPVTVFRLPGVYGPMDALRSTAGKLSRKVLLGEEIALPPAPVTRDFVTAEDVAALCEAALRSRIFGTYVVATGHSLPLREIVALLERGLQRRAVLGLRPTSTPRDADLRFDPSRLRAAFPRVALEPMSSGLERYGEWARRHGSSLARETPHGVNQ